MLKKQQQQKKLCLPQFFKLLIRRTFFFPRIVKHWIPLKRIFLSSCTFQLQYFSLSLYIVFEAKKKNFLTENPLKAKFKGTVVCFFFAFCFTIEIKYSQQKKKFTVALHTLEWKFANQDSKKRCRMKREKSTYTYDRNKSIQASTIQS